MYKQETETTDLKSKIVIGARSLFRWHTFELDRLRIERRLFATELAKTKEPAHRAELQQALLENTTEQQALDASWEHSSLRRKLTPSENAQAEPIIEKRIVSMPTSSNLLAEPTESRVSDTKTKLTGYAAIFDKDSENLGGFIEQIAPGAFADAIKISDVRGLYNHDSNYVLGRTKNKSLRLYEDKIGLRFYADMLPNDAISQGVVSRIARGDVSGCSFSFITQSDEWILPKKPGDTDLRIITKVKKLFDVGPVTYPAYPDTSVSVLQERAKTPTEKNAEFLRMQAEDDELWWNDVLRQRKERQREIERKFRLAGRIINRNKAALGR